MNHKIKIEFQHFEDCPNSELLLTNLKNAMKGYEDKIELSDIIINTQELSKKYNFRGSPTLLIEGKDIDDMPQSKNPSLSCRFYQNGVPSKEAIKAKILLLIK